VRLGANRRDILETGAQIVTASVSYAHPNYASSTLRNDIALIQLPRIVLLNSECSFEIVIDDCSLKR
jgi:hypothetical protein